MTPADGRLPFEILNLVALEHPRTPASFFFARISTKKKFKVENRKSVHGKNNPELTPFFAYSLIPPLFASGTGWSPKSCHLAPLFLPLGSQSQSSPCGSGSCSGQRSILHHTTPGGDRRCRFASALPMACWFQMVGFLVMPCSAG